MRWFCSHRVTVTMQRISDANGRLCGSLLSEIQTVIHARFQEWALSKSCLNNVLFEYSLTVSI